MTSLREMKQKGYIPQRKYIKLLTLGGISLFKVLITNLGDIKKLSQTTAGPKKFKRLPKKYKLPEYKEGMKYFNKDEKYLRPTLHCNSHSKKIIALANHLGAFKKSDEEFSEAAFEWCKRNLILEILPMDGVDKVLERGSGTCLHINSVFVALCRAAGIKARYKMFTAIESQSMYNDVYDSMMRKWYDALGYFSMEADIEVYIDGEWIVGHAGPTPERQVAMKVPITKFGEESIGVWFEALPGTMMWSESLPYGIGFITKALMKIAPGSVDELNSNIVNQIEQGRKILSEISEKEYDEKTRKTFRAKFPEIKIEKNKNIVFED